MTTRVTTMNETDTPKLLDVDGLEKYLALPKATIYTWVSTGKIPKKAIVHLGRALRFDREEIDRWVNGLRDAGAAGA